ncbi:MAG: TrkH family potassium uptake protein, partial [Clostridia bacterium]|nr:TrkH family potassium uptake protein [Clostridia bacterium]
GLKLARVIILFKMIKKEFNRMLHPRSVNVVKLEGKQIDAPILETTGVYFALYMISIILIFFVLSFEPFGFTTNFSAAVSCFNNIGPGFDKIGPMSNFSCYNDFSTIVLTFAMLLGRLELFPVLICFSPSTWAKK